MKKNIQVTINGKPFTLSNDATLLNALQKLQIDPSRSGIAVALGYDVIPRTKWSETTLQNNDEIEIVTATQGG